MPWLAALLVGAASNLDNLGAGVALGIRRTRVDATANLIVAGITMLATAGTVKCGHVISKLLPAAVTGWLGPLIIITIGIATIRTSARTTRTADAANVSWGKRCYRPDFDDVISRFGMVFGRLALGRHAPLVAGILLLAVGVATLPSVR